MNEPLDIYKVRQATKKVVNRPEWLKEKGFFYSKRYQRNFQVTGILGGKVFFKLDNQIKNEAISVIEEPRTAEESNQKVIDTGLISYPIYRGIAEDYLAELVAIKILPEQSPSFSKIPETIEAELISAISQLGIKQFYSHQTLAWEILKNNGSIVITTPTASGKSMAFMPKVFHEAIANQRSSLLIYPLKALAADQYRKLVEINDRLPAAKQLFIAKCTGDVPKEQRRQYFQGKKTPDLIVASPDVLHHLLYHTGNYRMAIFHDFLARLSTIVCDESHSYISSFGIHFANLLRRLRLAVENKGGDNLRLSWVIATATIANPEELGAIFTGFPTEKLNLIAQSGAKTPQRTFLIMKPQSAPNFATVNLIRDFLGRDLKGLVFVNSRRTAKSIFSILEMEMSGAIWGVELFYGTLTPAARSRLINRLSSGSLRIIITTSALEAGVDLPSLDFVILRGTTSLNSLWQRAGRAGRSTPGLVVLVPDASNHIDYYYAKQPDRLFDSGELVKLQPNYPHILAKHMLCAAAEGGIDHRKVSSFFGKSSELIAEELIQQNQLSFSRNGNLYLKGYPHKEVSLRGIVNEKIQLIDKNNQELIEELTLDLAHREAHKNAIYVTTSESKTVPWKCLELNVKEKTAQLERMTRDDLRTVPDVEIEVKPEKLLEEPKIISTRLEGGNLRLSLWLGTIEEIVSGYKTNQFIYAPVCQNNYCELYKKVQDRRLKHCGLCGGKLKKGLVKEELEEVQFKEKLITSYQAPILRIEVNDKISKEIDSQIQELRARLLKIYGDKENIPELAGSLFEPNVNAVALTLHSLSHMIIKGIPLTFLASDKDVNSLVKNRDNQGNNNANKTVVYLYDNVAEGCGTTEAIFTDWNAVLDKAHQISTHCDCGDIGCPRCLTLHNCPERNQGLSKLLGLNLLEKIV
ncbi:MAG: DEAD/DEAH box helicase [Prochloraceae cyanobacterium]|nr:DEAD/DEAH box helicase [Prochloraceae cyanobacterium]